MNSTFLRLREDIKVLKNHVPINFFEDCLKYDTIFHLHIPKTGGTFFRNAIEYSKINLINPPHGTCNSISIFPDPTDAIPGKNITYYPDQNGYENSLKVAIVRNPYDWLVSFYYHEVGENNLTLSDQPALELNQIKGVGSIRKVYKTYEEFIFAFCDPDAYWPEGLRGFKNFIPFQIFNDDGECQANFCLRNEFLNLASYCLMLGFGVNQGKAAPIFDFDRKNTSTRPTKDYRYFYTQKMVDALEVKLERENKFLMYDFESGPKDKNFIIDLKNLNYSPISNKIS